METWGERKRETQGERKREAQGEKERDGDVGREKERDGDTGRKREAQGEREENHGERKRDGEGVRECVLGLHLWLAVASSTRSLLSLKKLISLASSVVRSSAATPSAKHFCKSIDKIDT